MKIVNIKAVMSHVLEMDDGNTYRRDLNDTWEIYEPIRKEWVSIWEQGWIDDNLILHGKLTKALEDYKDSM